MTLALGLPPNRTPARLVLAAAIAVSALIVAGASAAAQAPLPPASPQAGLRVASVSCTVCHKIDTANTGSVQADVPTFQEIANRQGMTATRVAGAIVVPHPPMPMIVLSRRDIADLAAYIMSLRDGATTP